MKTITEGKVYITIEKYLKSGQNLFIIYPYGSGGKMVEQIIKENFPSAEYVLADNYIKDENILTVEQLAGLAKTHILLLCSDHSGIYEDIRKNLKEKFGGIICDLVEIDDPEEKKYGFMKHKMLIEDVDQEQTKNVFEKTKRAWKKLGEEEPFFSVLTHDELKTESITEEMISKFYESGRSHTAEILNYLRRYGMSDFKNLSILELGCGCGRITQSLAENFGHVVAIDISEGNLEIARQNVISENVEFELIKELPV